MTTGEEPPDSQIETYYERWDKLQAFLADLDPALELAPVEGITIKPGTIEVTYSEVRPSGSAQRVVTTLHYRFGQRRVDE